MCSEVVGIVGKRFNTNFESLLVMDKKKKANQVLLCVVYIPVVRDLLSCWISPAHRSQSLCHGSPAIPNVCLSVLAACQTLCSARDVLQGAAPWDVSVKHKLLPLEKELLILAASKPLDATGLQEKMGSGRGVAFEDL